LASKLFNRRKNELFVLKPRIVPQLLSTRSQVAIANRGKFRPLPVGKLMITLGQPIADLNELLKFIASKEGNVKHLHRRLTLEWKLDLEVP
jgi:hypothetical protein